ncbi:MAG: hypothetical protein IJP33_01715 [Firmicutes bacterium]|nr:hypothetical protein [Bacillota bacterium]
MKKRIFWGIFITAFLVQLITVVLILPVVDSDFRAAMLPKLLDEMLGSLLLVSALALLLAALSAHFQTKRIMRPINEIDPERPFVMPAYEELNSLLTKLNNQQQKIADQMHQLQSKQEEFLDITDNMSEAMVILGKDKRVLSANYRAKELFGSSVLNGKSYIELCREACFVQAATAAYEGRESECSLQKYGRSYAVSFTPVQSSGGTACVFFARDITEKANAEKLRREFSANVSHELKTPLTSIMGYAELIKAGIAKPEDIPQFGGKIHKEAERLLALIEDIIHLSMLDEGDIKAEFHPVELYGLAESVIEELQPKAVSRGISLRLGGESQTVLGIRGLLHEMLFNLCDNAIAYNRPDGSVIVNIGNHAGKAFVSVIDTGIGIEPQEQSRVFERFYRVDKSRSRETGGTGLGLSIVKHTALLHGAEINLESKPNEGTKIIILFPIQEKSDS